MTDTANAIIQKMQEHPNWSTLSDRSKSVLAVIAHKIRDVVEGAPSAWGDIAHYAKLEAHSVIVETEPR